MLTRRFSYEDNDHLELYTYSISDLNSRSAEIFTRGWIQYGSFRVSMSINGPGGGVAGFFTYRTKAEPDNEQDIEILTTEPNTQIQ